MQTSSRYLLRSSCLRAVGAFAALLVLAAMLLERGIQLLLLRRRQNLFDLAVNLLPELLQARLEAIPHLFGFHIATVENLLDLRALLRRQAQLVRKLGIEQQAARSALHGR